MNLLVEEVERERDVFEYAIELDTRDMFQQEPSICSVYGSHQSWK